MSYARFGAEDSDVYVFLHAGGWLECCACQLQPLVPERLWPPSWRASSTAQMARHLWEHRDAGHTVPARTFVALEVDQEENDAWIAAGGPSGGSGVDGTLAGL